ncbi:3-keto-5-aminohexanoate cleavage protein [Rhodoligotrophos ferricapiens]|uniref:3-keto-5-aminohexanoate cleavage protein n=1 Tax=Rhodoligotrophos ferricapiens TaxID=3069264 RepID=UPI00315CAEE0
MSRPVIICCAVTGSADTPSKNPAVPVTPQEIARSALDAAAAGAAIVHIHVRDPKTTRPSLDLELYRETVDLIKAENKDVIINLTTGTGARFVPGREDPQQPGPGTNLSSPEIRTRHIEALKPDICSLDMGTMNMGDTVFMNTPGHLAAMAEVIGRVGVVPELEVFEAGHIRLTNSMIERGLLKAPHLFQICLGVPWGQPATTEAMVYMKHMLPAGAQWFAFGIGLHQFPMAAQAVVLGGHVRVGLEDNLYLGRGELAPSNAALVERAVEIVKAIGHPIATPAQAREIIGI